MWPYQDIQVLNKCTFKYSGYDLESGEVAINYSSLICSFVLFLRTG